MKRIVLLIIAIFIMKIVASGQGLEWSVRGGLNVADLRGATWNAIAGLTDVEGEFASFSNRAGVNLGVYSSVPLSRILSVETGLAYDQKGMGFMVVPFESGFLNPKLNATLKLDYLSLPVNLVLKTAGGLSITGGAGVSHLIDSRVKVRGSVLGIGLGEDFRIQNTFNDWDVNLRAGLIYDFGNGLLLKTEYQHGLSRIYENIVGVDTFNSGISITAGYKF